VQVDIPSASPGFRGIIWNMGDEATELLKKALTLPVAERAELAGSLIESLDEAVSIRERSNRSLSKKHGADFLQLSNDRAATLFTSRGS
jgi:hypothetical protein